MPAPRPHTWKLPALGAAALTAALLLAAPAPAGAQAPPPCDLSDIERWMRELQARWENFSPYGPDDSIEWPPACPDGRMPHYPKDDAYDAAIASDPEMGVTLVRFMRDALCGNMAQGRYAVTDWFLDPETKEPAGEDGATYAFGYLSIATDFPALECNTGPVDASNYCEVFEEIKRALALCDTLGFTPDAGACGGSEPHYRYAADPRLYVHDEEQWENLDENWEVFQAPDGPIGVYLKQIYYGDHEDPLLDHYYYYATANPGRICVDPGSKGWRTIAGRVDLLAWFDEECAGPGDDLPAGAATDGDLHSLMKAYTPGELVSTPLYADLADRPDYFPALGPPPPPAETCHEKGWQMAGRVGTFKPDFDTSPDAEEECCASCDSCAPGQPKVRLGSVQVFFPMGRTSAGLAAGYLQVRGGLMLPRLADAGSLRKNLDPTVARAGTGAQPRQYYTGQVLAHTENLAAGDMPGNVHRVRLSFYSATGLSVDGTGLYPLPVAGPYTQTEIEYKEGSVADPRNPAGSVAGRSLTVRTTGQGAGVWRYVSVGRDWALQSGLPAVGAGPALRTETLLLDEPEGAGTLPRTETRTVTGPTGALAERDVRVYAMVAGAERMTSHAVGAAGQEWTTATYYHATTGGGAREGHVGSVVSPAGAWQRFEYDANGYVTKVVSQVKDAPITATDAASRVSTFRELHLDLSDADAVPETVYERVDSLLGHEVARSYTIGWSFDAFATERQIWTVRCSSPADPGNLTTFLNAVVAAPIAHASEVTVRVVETASPNRTLATISPDGTKSSWTYQLATGEKTVTVETERVNDDLTLPAPRRILRKTVTVTTSRGLTKDRSVYEYRSDGTQVLVDHIWTDPATETDALGRALTVHHLDGTIEEFSYDCCGLEWAKDREGVKTTYTYDDLRRARVVSREVASGQSIASEYTFDAAGRTLTETRRGTDNSTMLLRTDAYAADGRLTSTADGLGNTTVYGRAIVGGLVEDKETLPDPDGGAPDSPEIKRISYPDGTLKKVEGTGAHTVSYDFGVENDATLGHYVRYSKEARGTAGTQWTKEYRNALDQRYKLIYPGTPTPTETWAYDTRGRLTKRVDADGVTTLHAQGYGAAEKPAGSPAATGNLQWSGSWELTCLDMDQDGAIDYTGTGTAATTDRLSLSRSEIVAGGAGQPSNVRRATTVAWSAHSGGTSSTDVHLLSTSDSGLDGLRSWGSRGGLTSTTVTVYDRANKRRTATATAPDGSYSVEVAEYGRALSSTRFDGSVGHAQHTKLTFGYDPHGRQTTVTDVRDPGTGADDLTTTTAYDGADRPTSVTTPVPGPGQSAQTTGTVYDALGRVTTVNLPLSRSRAFTYHPTGEVKTVRGSETYPVDYTYDDQGRLQTLKTWKATDDPAKAAVTTWNYDPDRGWLTSKLHPHATTAGATGVGPSYTYWPSGRPKTRTWARGVVTTYTYTPAGDPLKTDYSDATPDVTYSYDRRGRTGQVVDAVGTRTLEYDALDQPTFERFQTGSLFGTLYLKNTYDATARRSKLEVFRTATDPASPSTSYTYDALSRLETVTYRAFKGSYTYRPYTDELQRLELREGVTTNVIHANYTRDGLGRAALVEWRSGAFGGGGAVDQSYAYTYNDANQRTRVTLADGSYWKYGYDTLGQVTSGVRFFDHAPTGSDAGDAPVPGAQFGYWFDDIGNRTQTTLTDASLATPLAGDGRPQGRSAAYTSDLLNRYSQRTVPRSVDVDGFSALGTVNLAWNDWGTGRTATASRPAAPYQAHFWALATYAGTPNNELVSDTVDFGTWTSYAFLPATPEPYTYDSDGNLTGDGAWVYTWDGENRLATVSHTAALTLAVGTMTLTYTYDHLHRRVRKLLEGPGIVERPAADIGGEEEEGLGEAQLDGVAGVGPYPAAGYDRRFVYDGWNLQAEYDWVDSALSEVRTYAWGLDLSGSLHGAGGVGGLLFTAPVGTYPGAVSAALHDGNGNVTGLRMGLDPADFSYGPFGEPVADDGPPKQPDFPFGFSTRYGDAETGLVYYGHRYYNPETGRWISRDPIGEADAECLYCMVSNGPVDRSDYLGLWKNNGDWSLVSDAPASAPTAAYNGTVTAECGDMAEDLAFYITGSRSDANLINLQGEVKQGEIVDISPLLRELERKLRRNVTASTGLRAGFGRYDIVAAGPIGNWDSAKITRQFGPGADVSVDCHKATRLVLANGLIKSLVNGNEFDQVFKRLGGMPLRKRTVVNEEEVRVGDRAYIEGHPLYMGWSSADNIAKGKRGAGDWGGEDVIKVGPDAYWGHGVGGRSFSVDQWKRHLLAATWAVAPKGVIVDPGDIMGMQKSTIEFLDVVKVGSATFDHRQKAAKQGVGGGK